MGASGEVGASLPASGGGLQPDDQASVAAFAPGVAEATALRELRDDKKLTEEMDPAVARLATLLADQDAVARFREAGFAGPGYEAFKSILASYGLPVMRAWIQRGQIFALSAERGRRVGCPDWVREHLARDCDARLELAMDVVAKALVLFREQALVRERWTPTGGAVLSTYFVGCCVLAFSNVFRAWLKEQEAGRRDRRIEIDPSMQAVPTDPADVVCAMDTFCQLLESAPSDTGRALLAELVVQDKPYAVLAERFGMTEAAVKQMIYRFRRAQSDQGRSTR